MGWDDLTEDERAAVIAAAKLTYDRSRRPYSPDNAVLREALIKLGVVKPAGSRALQPPLSVTAGPSRGGRRGKVKR